MSFQNKVALVTGGGSGIGEAVAKDLAALGVKVVVADIGGESGRRVVDEIAAAGGAASAIVANSASPQDNEKAVAFAVQTYGRLNYAVNNAGIGGNAAPAGEVDLDDWKRVIDINLHGVLYGMRYQIPAMLAAGARECAIVNMASIHGAVANIGHGAYTAAKHGVVGLTRNAAAEYGPQGLRVNCVGPGYIDTPLLADLPGEFRQELVGRHPWAGSARPPKSRPWSASCSPTMRRSSPAATTSSTAATPLSSGMRLPGGHPDPAGREWNGECRELSGCRRDRMGAMHRRLLTIALVAWPARQLLAQQQAQRPRRKIAASQLFEALSARFPLRLAAPGLLQLEVSAAALLLAPTRDKIGAALELELGGPALRDRVHGQADLLFSLRYEATDRTLRGRDPEVGRLRLPGLAGETADAVEGMTRSLLAGLPGEVVLHRFTQRELALPDAMGFEPGELTVLEDGVEIEFRPKARP